MLPSAVTAPRSPITAVRSTRHVPIAATSPRSGYAVAELLVVFAVLGGLAAAVLSTGSPGDPADSQADALGEIASPVREIAAVGADGRLVATLYDDRCLLRRLGDSMSSTLWVRSGDDAVSAIAASVSPARVALCHGSGLVSLLDAETRAFLRQVELPLSNVTAAAMTADGTTLAVNGEATDGGRVILVIDAATGQEQARIANGTAADAIAFLPDGRLLGPARRTELVVWNATTGRESERMPVSPGVVTALAADAGGTTIAVGTVDGRLLRWDLASGAVATVDHDRDRFAVMSVAFLADGRLATGSVDTVVRLWNHGLDDWTTLTGHTRSVRGLAVVGETLVTGSHDGTVRRWDGVGTECRRLEEPAVL